jgi:hypothetical protein
MNHKPCVKILIILVILAVLDYALRSLLETLSSTFPKGSTYFIDAQTGITVIIIAVGVGGYFIIKIFRDLINQAFLSKLERDAASTVRVVLDVIFYTILVVAILAAL